MNKEQNDGWTSETIFNRVLYLCGQNGWSITRLAELSEMTASTIYSYRYRKSMPKIESLVSMCNAFGISLAKFFMVGDDETEELMAILNSLSTTSKVLLKEVAKRMKD